MDAIKKMKNKFCACVCVWEKERERERERSNLFCVRKLSIEWKRKCQIYNNMLRIKRVNINAEKRVENEWY